MQIVPVIISLSLDHSLLENGNTILQETISSINKPKDFASPIIICNTDHSSSIVEQCQQIGVLKPTILITPVCRGKTYIIAAAALQSLKFSDDAVLLILSSGQTIQYDDVFHDAIKLTREGWIVIFGIAPTDVNSKYIYIKSIKDDIDVIARVDEFVVNIDPQIERTYSDQVNYLWNSDMYIFQANTLIDELTLYFPKAIVSTIDAVDNAIQDDNFIHIEQQVFEQSHFTSSLIDYTFIEKSNNIAVVQLNTKKT